MILTPSCLIAFHQEPHLAKHLVTILCTINDYNPHQYRTFDLRLRRYHHRNHHNLSRRSKRRHCQCLRSMRRLIRAFSAHNSARRGNGTIVPRMPLYPREGSTTLRSHHVCTPGNYAKWDIIKASMRCNFCKKGTTVIMCSGVVWKVPLARN